jgi:phage shock protein E
MHWIAILILAAVVAAIFMLKQCGQIASDDALAFLKNGALVIDVRSRGEFNSGHQPAAINLPLDETETALPPCVKDKNQVFLPHCQSGMRSGMARHKLKGLGYPSTFNLGSLARAKQIVEAPRGA